MLEKRKESNDDYGVITLEQEAAFILVIVETVNSLARYRQRRGQN